MHYASGRNNVMSVDIVYDRTVVTTRRETPLPAPASRVRPES
jgi:hypothetical protein